MSSSPSESSSLLKGDKNKKMTPHEAFQIRDREASSIAHAARMGKLGGEQHTESGDRVKSIVFGV